MRDRFVEVDAVDAVAYDEEQDFMAVRGATLVREGESKNRNRYPGSVLAASTDMFEGLPCYFGHQTNDGNRVNIGGKSDPRNLAGTWSNIRYESGALKGDLRLSNNPVWGVLTTAKESGGLVGLSLDMAAEFKVLRENGRLIRQVVAFQRDPHNSVDIVVNPAAGGRLFESVTDWWTQFEEQTMNENEKAGTVQESTGAASPPAADESKGRVVETPAPPAETARAVEAVQAEATKARELREKAEAELCGLKLERRLTEAKLPTEFEALVRKDFAGRIFEAEALETRITEVKAAIDAVTASGKVRENGAQVEVTSEDWDKRSNALLGLFTGKNEDGVPAFRSFKEAYFKCNPGKDYLLNPYEILHDTQIRNYDSARATETLLTSSWASIFASTVHRALIREFNAGPDQHWRAFASDISSIQDFRTQTRLHQGGFGLLDTVEENGTYQELDNPQDDAETFRITKRGNLYQITLESIANDDVGAIRRVPQQMGRAARITLNRDVLGFIDQANTTLYNPTMGDGVALFHTNSFKRGGNGSTSASGNLGTVALSASQLDVRRINMLRRATYGNIDPYSASGTKLDPGSISPKILFVSPTNQRLAWSLASSDVRISDGTVAGEYNATEPNYFKQFAYDVVTIEWFTDTNSWGLCADPRSAPTLEVGFFQGRQEPDIFTRDEFTKDALTYKIRFIYGWTPLEPLAWDYSDVAN